MYQNSARRMDFIKPSKTIQRRNHDKGVKANCTCLVARAASGMV